MGNFGKCFVTCVCNLNTYVYIEHYLLSYCRFVAAKHILMHYTHIRYIAYCECTKLAVYPTNASVVCGK